MKHTWTKLGFLALGGVLLVGVLALVGCEKQYSDDKQAVYNTLGQHDLSSVEVFQDRRSGEITLRGIVGSEDRKSQAESLARQAAPDYAIKNQIQVQSAGLEGLEKNANQNAALDSAIADKFKARLQSDKRLEKENIQYSADSGTLYLKGTVKTARAKKEVEDLAKRDPQVKQVVNDIAVKPS